MGRPPRRNPRGFGLIIGIVLALGCLALFFNMFGGLFGTLVHESAPFPPTPNGPTVSYQNEGYVPPEVDKNPPAVPGPRDLTAAGILTKDNPLYLQDAPTPTNCAMHSASVVTMTAMQKSAHFNELTGCLMAVWANPVSDAGFTLPRPRVVVYTKGITTACGDFDKLNALYCSGDQRIYFADGFLDALGEAASTRYAAEAILAHEFGHAVQARTGILISDKYKQMEAKSKATRQELSRRTEVQADCFAGVFVRSVAHSQKLSEADLDALRRFFHNIGDDVLSGKSDHTAGHGTGQAREAWFSSGMSDNQLKTCNSYAAPATKVR